MLRPSKVLGEQDASNFRRETPNLYLSIYSDNPELFPVPSSFVHSLFASASTHPQNVRGPSIYTVEIETWSSGLGHPSVHSPFLHIRTRLPFFTSLSL